MGSRRYLNFALFHPCPAIGPFEARLLPALALTRTSDPAEIARIFATY